MGLIDEADIAAPDAGAFDIAQVRGGDTVDKDFAGVGMLEQAGNLQKRRFARTRRRDQRHRLTWPDRKFGAPEHVKRGIALMEFAADAMQKDERMRLIAARGRRGGLGDRGFLVHCA